MILELDKKETQMLRKMLWIYKIECEENLHWLDFEKKGREGLKLIASIKAKMKENAPRPHGA